MSFDAEVSEALPAGARVGAWIIDGVRSEGGFALLHHAHHADSGEPAAIKVLRRALSFYGNAVMRFHREIDALLRIVHPNVVRVLAHGDLPDGRPWLAMPWLDGEDLRVHIGRVGALSIADASAIVTPLASALDAVHAHGLVHRDVKAENVMLHGTPHAPVLVDFGVARDNDPVTPIALTTHSVLGTPSAMAPEQIMSSVVDARTDVYGLGVLVFHLVTGSLPFRTNNLAELLEMHLHAAPPPPSSRLPVPPELDALVQRCMAKERAERPASAREVAEELAAIALDRPRPSSAIYVEARIDPDVDDPDDAALDDVHAAISLAATTLRAEGIVDVHPNAVLALLPVDAERARTLTAHLGVVLAARDGRSPIVRVTWTVHFAVARDDLRAAAAWAAPSTEGGAFATLAAANGDPAAGTTLVRVR